MVNENSIEKKTLINFFSCLVGFSGLHSHGLFRGFAPGEEGGVYADSSIDPAIKNAFTQTHKWMMAKYDLTEFKTWTIITQAVNFGITQLVDGNWGMHALIPKSVFEGVERTAACNVPGDGQEHEDSVEDEHADENADENVDEHKGEDDHSDEHVEHSSDEQSNEHDNKVEQSGEHERKHNHEDGDNVEDSAVGYMGANFQFILSVGLLLIAFFD